MPNKQRCDRKLGTAGFSSLDLVIVLFTVVLIAAFAWAAFLGPARQRSARVGCVSHLKQIGLGFLVWANDNEGKFPMAVSTKNEGSMEYNYSGEVFQHYGAMKNELNSPKVLRCPNDVKRLSSISWDTFGNTNVSYFVGLSAAPSEDETILTGDRNLKGGIGTNGNVVLLDAIRSPVWTTEIHNRFGNIGLADGSAQQVTDEMLRAQLVKITNRPTLIAIP